MNHLLLLFLLLPLIGSAQSGTLASKESGARLLYLENDTLTVFAEAKVNFIKIEGKLFRVVRNVDLKEEPTPTGLRIPQGGVLFSPLMGDYFTPAKSPKIKP